MYPIHLEHHHEKYVTARFDAFCRRLAGRVIPRLEAHIEATGSSSVSLSARHDAPEDDIFQFLEKIRAEYGRWIPADAMEAAIRRNFSLIDAWSRDKTTQLVEEMMTRLNTPQSPSVTGRPSPTGKSGEKWLTAIDLLSRESGLAATQLDRIVKTNLGLIRSLQGDQFEDVYNAISGGLTRGDGLSKIAENIRHATGANRSRAKFWARDQASKFFGEVTKTRQTDAGIPGYVWRTVGDARVRDTHAAVSGRYFDWTKPPAAGVRGNAVHPGEDFNCRCWAEPAFGPEYADRGAQTESPEPGGPDATGKPEIRDALAYLKQNWATKEVLFGVPIEPMASKGGKNKYSSWKRYEELSTLSKREVVDIVGSARRATWDRFALSKHAAYTDIAHDFSGFGRSFEDVALDILKNHDRVFANYWFKQKRIAFFSKKYNAMAYVDEKTGKIMTVFKYILPDFRHFTEIL